MRISAIVLLTLPAAILFAGVAQGENWPTWRGPRADGTSLETGLPVQWSRTENIAWKVPLAGTGNSTPIVWGDRVILTSQTGNSPLAEGSRDFPGAVEAEKFPADAPVSFLVQAFDRRDGSLLWEYRLVPQGHLEPVHIKHNYASPSCVTDGELIYAWFATGEVVALDMDGKEVWTRSLGEEVAPFEIRWGHGSSPTLYGDSLLLLCDHPPGSYLLALDKRTGKRLWKTDRGEGLRSYTTPFVVQADSGDELIINTNSRLEAVDPKTGEPLWHVGEANRVPVPTPVYHGGVIYSNRGYNSGPYLAVRPGGRGDVGETHLEWRVPTGGPYVSSLLHHNGLIYMANERGIVSAVDAESGERVWRERMGGVFSASPVVADGKIYLVDETGETFVLEAGRTAKILSRNLLDERTLASPAISQGRIFIRTDKHLWAIGAGGS